MSLCARVIGTMVLLLSCGVIVAEPAEVGPAPKQWSDTVDKAVAFLRTTQAADGSWSKEKSLGVTGVVLTGLLKAGVPPSDPMVDRGLKFLESLINWEERHIAGKNPKNQLKNYVTSVSAMAFAEANRDGRYDKVLKMASGFLKELQWDEGEGKPPQDTFYGGFGYDSKNRPDMSNTQMAIDALRAAGIPENDPALQRALRFISRCQNLKGEYNDQPWAGKINDGGFIYTAAGGGDSKAGGSPMNGLASYGSMTYAGIKSMIYAGVKKDDPRVKAARDWIGKHYTVEENPGMPRDKNMHLQGLFYYYHTMAKCLDALGEDHVVDAKRVKHDWRKDITEALAKRQKPEGSWSNDADRWFEGDPNLVCGYALMTLSYCKPKR